MQVPCRSSPFYRYATIFFSAALQLFCYCMLAENQDFGQETLCRTDGSFRREKYSLNTTQINSICDRTSIRMDLNKQDSQPTLPELPPYSSRALDFEQTSPSSSMDHQISELMHRFSGIHKMLIQHSEYESSLHEKKRGFKAIAVDRTQLTADYSNKVAILSDIVTLVEALEMETQTKNIQQLLDTKYLEYYLQRHYGGLTGEFNNLSIQEKLDEEEEKDEENRGYAVSELEKCDSLRQSENESHILISEPSDDELVESIQVTVERIRIIEVQIPVVIFKTKEMVVKYEESDVRSQINNIDSIINRYSEPYENFYKNQREGAQVIYINSYQQQQQHQQLPPAENIHRTPIQSNILAVGSIMIDSNHNSLRPKETEVELIYSDFPEEQNFKLPLDSYAQLESLLSHVSGSSTDRQSRPPTERENLIPINEEGIMITEKGATRSLLEKIEQNERMLNEQNLELKETIAFLQERLCQLQARNKELEVQSNKLAQRLEEQIQQAEYFAGKLDEINAEILEEKVDCLTHLNQTKERKIEALQQELTERSHKIADLGKEFLEMEKALHLSVEEITKKDDYIQIICKQLQEKEQELHQLETCEDTVIQLAVNSEENLRKQIEKIELQKVELNDEIRQYKRRLKVEGISLEYEEAAEIKGIIESREHTYTLQLLDINKRYEEVMSIYQDELKQLKNQLKDLNDINQKKSELLASKDAKELLIKMKNEKYFKQFQEIIKEYDRQLEQKDEEILGLKLNRNGDDVQLVLHRFTSTIALLENQLAREREEKAKITGKFIQLDEIVRCELAKQQKMQDTETEQRLIEQLTIELQKKMSENKLIKKMFEDQSTLITNLLEDKGKMEAAAHIKKDNDKLRDINRKLKRYTVILQNEIKAVCSVDECESHRNWVSNLMAQKNYFCDLLTREGIPLEVKAGN